MLSMFKVSFNGEVSENAYSIEDIIDAIVYDGLTNANGEIMAFVYLVCTMADHESVYYYGASFDLVIQTTVVALPAVDYALDYIVQNRIA